MKIIIQNMIVIFENILSQRPIDDPVQSRRILSCDYNTHCCQRHCTTKFKKKRLLYNVLTLLNLWLSNDTPFAQNFSYVVSTENFSAPTCLPLQVLQLHLQLMQRHGCSTPRSSMLISTSSIILLTHDMITPPTRPCVWYLFPVL